MIHFFRNYCSKRQFTTQVLWDLAITCDHILMEVKSKRFPETQVQRCGQNKMEDFSTRKCEPWLSKFFRCGQIGTICPETVDWETNSSEGGKDDGGGKKDRGKVFCFPELTCCMFDWLGTNEKFSSYKTTTVRLSSFNETYTQRVKWMKEQDKWRDQHGKPVTDMTTEKSIEELVREVNLTLEPRTHRYRFKKSELLVWHNELVSLFDKILDKDDKIPTGKQVPDMW